jgi:hypothetical protein
LRTGRSLHNILTIEDISPGQFGMINLRKSEIVNCDNTRSYDPVESITGLKYLRIAGHSKNTFDTAILSALSDLEELEIDIYNMLINTQELGKLVRLKKLRIKYPRDNIDLKWIVNLTESESFSLEYCGKGRRNSLCGGVIG